MQVRSDFWTCQLLTIEGALIGAPSSFVSDRSLAAIFRSFTSLSAAIPTINTPEFEEKVYRFNGWELV